MYDDYIEYKKSNKFVPYLPEISPLKKELHYEMEAIWYSCPNGVRYLEDITELKEKKESTLTKIKI